MNPAIPELTAAVEQEAKKRPEVLRLITHPGVGPLTARSVLKNSLTESALLEMSGSSFMLPLGGLPRQPTGP